MKKILVINGPNLNLLGQRETGHYGSETLASIEAALQQQAAAATVEIEFMQSNHEGAIVDRIGKNDCDFIIINPGAYTHTSIAIQDALRAVTIPAIEVHLSNIYAREEFRHHSYIAPACIGQISGLGRASYTLALRFAIQQLIEND